MANIFVHFEPTGHSLRHNARVAKEHGKDVHEKYRDALKRGVAGHENDNNHGLPSYIIAGTPEEAHWRMSHPNGQVGPCCVILSGARFPEEAHICCFYVLLNEAITNKVFHDGFNTSAHCCTAE